MKQSKKNKPRPRFICEKCGMLWVNHDPVCILCGLFGKPLNEGAEKVIRKVSEANG